MLTYYEYAALSKTPHALADGLMLVFSTLLKEGRSPAEIAAGSRSHRKTNLNFSTVRLRFFD
jgi:hypothetical protein